MQTPVFNPFAPNFYPDFGTGFPIPVSMIHLLPQSEKNREHYGSHQSQLTPDDDVIKSERDRVKELEEEHQQQQQDMFRSPALSRDDRRELVQQNGQD